MLLKVLLVDMKAKYQHIYEIGYGKDDTKQQKNALFSLWSLELE